MKEEKHNDAKRFDVWALIAVRYSLRVLGLRAEFCKLASEDPTYAKLVLPALERRGDVAASDDLNKPLGNLESHMTTQLMKSMATLSASNATKLAQGRGGPADNN